MWRQQISTLVGVREPAAQISLRPKRGFAVSPDQGLVENIGYVRITILQP